MTSDVSINWGAVPTEMRPHLLQYRDLIQQLAGEHAVALTCFGAVSAGTFDPQRDAAANVLVLSQHDLQVLRALGEQGPKLGQYGIAAPWVMTPEYLRSSTDTFPLELIEIQQNHVTLLGADLFSELTFEPDDVRLACERELKLALLHLQHGLLAAAGEEKRLDQLAHKIGTELVRTMRGLLWGKGHTEALPARDVIQKVESTFNRPLGGVRQAADRYSRASWETFESLYRDVEALSEIADAG